MMLHRTAPFMLQTGSAAPSPVKPLSPPGKGAERKPHRELAELWLLSSLGMRRSLAGGSKAAPAVGHGVGFVRWYPGCPVIPPLRLYRQRRVLKLPRVQAGSHPRAFPPVGALGAVVWGGQTHGDGVTALPRVLPPPGAGMWGHPVCPFS